MANNIDGIIRGVDLVNADGCNMVFKLSESIEIEDDEPDYEDILFTEDAEDKECRSCDAKVSRGDILCPKCLAQYKAARS